MKSLPGNYHQIIDSLKEKIRNARLRASLVVNKELLLIYWEIGKTILEQQKIEGWGSKVIDRLSGDLKMEFPDFKGLSVRNLKYMRAFAEIYPDFQIVQQVVAQNDSKEYSIQLIVQQAVAQLPWGHHQVLLDKIKKQKGTKFLLAKMC